MKRLFLHMPKCAGTSVRQLLEKNCSQDLHFDYDSFFRIPRNFRNSVLTDSLFEPKPIDDNRIIFGHFFPVKYLGARNVPNCKLVTILRDPISRLISHYRFWRAGNFSDHYLWRNLMQKNWSFEEFALSDDMRNFYAQHMVGLSFSAFDYIGISEDMKASVLECFSVLGIRVNDSIQIPNENVTPKSEHLDLSEDLVRKLRAHHADDMLIYEFAKRKFHSGLPR